MSRTLAFVASFGVARGSLFLAPIVIANVVPADVYGEIELAQAVASLMAVVLAAGSGAAIPLVLVQHAKRLSWPSLLLHQGATSCFLLVLAIILLIVGAPRPAWLVCASTAVLLLQGFWSVHLKSLGRPETSLVLESGFWCVLALAGLVGAAVLPIENRAIWLWPALAGYLAGLITWTVWRFVREPLAEATTRYWETLRLTFPLMATGLLGILVTASGRLGVGFLTTTELTADYSALFRATAIPLVAHQIVMVARFRQLFEGSTVELEQKLRSIVAPVVWVVILFWALADVIAPFAGVAFQSAFERYRCEGIQILLQCILWSSIALNDLINSRTMTAGSVVRGVGIFTVMAVAGISLYFSQSMPIGLETFVPVHSALMFGFYVTQIGVMARCGIRLWRTWSTAALSFLGLSLLNYLLS